MAAMGTTMNQDRVRDIARRLREQAEYHREQWKELNGEAVALEVQLPEHTALHVTPSPARAKREPYEIMVREIAYELTQAGATFLTADVVDAGVPYQSAMKWLKEWEARGTLESIVDGTARVWARTRHESEPVNRPKAEAPEARVIAFERSAKPVAGTGRRDTISDPGVKALVEQCRAKGAQVNKLRNGHFQVRLNGVVIGGIPGTPSDHRSLPNCRADLRRNGLPV